jgi:hypothetical protein
MAEQITARVVRKRMKPNALKWIVRKLRTACIVHPVTRNWKWFRAVALAGLLFVGGGCSGIRASKSISPLDFILPGLMQNETPAPKEVPASTPPELLASAG